ncbi:MAG: LptF/LptG family permease [Planctomycetota bacterium]
MRIITRYLLGDLLAVFLLTLLGMTTLIFVAMIGKEAIGHGLGPGPLVRMTPYLLPQAMQFAVPATMLLAVTSVYGRMSSSNEVVALKAAGVSPWSLAAPTLALAALVSLIAVALNDIAVSWGRLGVERVFIESIDEVIYGKLRVDHAYANDQISISVRRVEGHKLIEPSVTGFLSESGEAWSGSADWAELESLPSKDQVIFRFHNCEITTGPNGAFDPKTFEQVIGLEKLAGRDGHRSPSTYALAEISDARRRAAELISQLEQQQAADAAIALLTGDLGLLSQPAWEADERRLAGARFTHSRLGAEPYRRWAAGFSCLAFVAVGIPVAVILRTSEMLNSFFMCFGPIMLAYYPVFMFSIGEAKGGDVWPITVWAANVMLAFVGWMLMRKVIRY